jgi:uncharacterized protein YukE
VRWAGRRIGTSEGDAVSDRLKVDLDGLESFASQLKSIKDRMNGTRSMFDSYRDELGSGEVADALDSFEGNWKDGRKQIDSHLEGLSKMAEQVVREIRKADQELANELEKSTKGERPA